MLEVTKLVGESETPTATLTLPFEKRQKSRFRATLDDGRACGLVLPRGSTLRSGQRLRAEDGTVIEVRAEPEPLARVTASSALDLARGAYHLGNRHVALAIRPDCLLLLRDSVLEAMVIGLGLAVEHVEEPFEPESGAYGKHAHGHAHAHPHGHGRSDHGGAHAHGTGENPS